MDSLSPEWVSLSLKDCFIHTDKVSKGKKYGNDPVCDVTALAKVFNAR